MTNDAAEITVFQQLRWYLGKYRRLASTGEYRVYLLREHGGRALGYGALRRVQGALYVTECVDPQYRRRGLGRTILETLIRIGTVECFDLIADIYETNIPSLRLHQQAGFVAERRADGVVTLRLRLKDPGGTTGATHRHHKAGTPKMNAPSTVGIAIPAYGRGHELSQTLESALSQTRPADDIVVVDDCSPDSTEEVARSFAERGVRYARNARNLGVPENLNNALRMLSTDYVMILEDHDCLAPHFIEKCVGLLDANPEMVIAFTAIADAGDPTRRRREYRRSFPGVLPGREIARQIVTTTHAPFSVNALIRRSALLGLEPYFDPRYWWYADLYLWVRLALRGTVGYVPDPLLLLRDREPGHYLTGREWKTLLVCHQLRQDCWSLVFPSPGPESWIARARYQLSRDRAGIQQVVANISHGRPAGLDSPDLELRSYFSPVGWHLARLVSRLPTYSAVGIRRIYRRIT